MYLIKIYDGPKDSQGMIINSPFVGDLKCKYKIHPVLSGVSDMTITLNPANPGWNKIKPLRTLITAVDFKSGEEVFRGRVLKPTQSMSQNGLFSIQYICESKLAYLNDTNQRYGVYQNITITDFLKTIIDTHNAHSDSHKHFIVGRVTVTDPNDSIYRYLGYEKTYEAIQDKLIDRLGGYLVIREELDGTYLDYLKNVGEIRNTPIRLRTNLKSLQRDIDPTQIITRLIVLGAKLSEDADNHERLTFKSVNGGKDYLDNPSLISEFGIIEGTLTYDDINTPSTLLLRANQFFANQTASQNSYNVSAVDLSRIDSNFEKLEVGDWYQLEASPFAISEPLQIIGKTITDDNPQLDTLEIGDKFKTLTQYQYETNKRMKSYAEMQQQVENQSATIRNLSNQLNTANESIGKIQTELNNINIENLPTELQGIATQLLALQNTLGDIEQAIDQMPVYGPASSTSDGLLTAELYMKLQSIQLATALIDGLMSKEDKQKVNQIDNILQRLDALET